MMYIKKSNTPCCYIVLMIVFILSLSCSDSSQIKAETIPPISPSELQITFENHQWTLQWIDSSNNENGFKVWMSEASPDSLKERLVVAANKTECTLVCDFEPEKKYYFAVSAYNEKGESEKTLRSFDLTWEISGLHKTYLVNRNDTTVLYRDGKPFFIKGIGGTSNLELAREYGANAFRTWDGNDVATVNKRLKLAKENDMYLMNGFWLSQNGADYTNETYKNKIRQSVTDLAETFKDDEHLLIWCLGNEIEIKANTREAWLFVEELATIIKKIDPNHPVAVVISYNQQAAINIAKYAPSIDILGVNAYGAIGTVANLVAQSGFKGGYMITEWGPNGTWEVGKTSWGAPIEQTSEEKRQMYEKRYAYTQLKNCTGSFVFLWGQKQETTPSWFGMFAEQNISGLPLNGEPYSTTEAMRKGWMGSYPQERAPMVNSLKLDNKRPVQSVTLRKGEHYQALAEATHPNRKKIKYVWEILHEAKDKGIGGSYEPRPQRIGDVYTGDSNSFAVSVNDPGEYRLFVYVLDDDGRIGSANIPFKVN